MNREDIEKLWGLTKEEVENILGPSYLEARHQADEEMAKMRDIILERGEALATQLRALGANVHFMATDLFSRE